MNIKLNIDKSFFNEVYLPYLENEERYVVIMGGAGAGKSIFTTQKMILKACKYPNRKILVVRKVLATIRESCFSLFIDQLSKMNLLKYCQYTTSHMKITFPNGSQIIFVGLEDAERLKSITDISDIYLEEATECSENDLESLNLRLRSNQPNNQIHILFNPVSKNSWVYRYFFEDKKENTVILRVNYTHNKWLPQDYIDSLLKYKETNPLFYKIYALGEFGNLDRTIFNNYRIEKVEDKGDLLIGVDFGFSNDPSCAIALRMEGSNLYIVGEIYKKGLFIEDLAREIKRKGWERYPIFADSSEPRSIADLKRNHNLKIKAVKKGKDSINHGISWLQNLNIIIDPSCVNTIKEFKDYTWLKDKDGIYVQKPNPNCSDHSLDSIRYGTEIIRLNSKVRFLDKKLFGL